MLLAPLAVGWLTATFVALTARGWWFPGRQIVVVLPLATIAVAWLLSRWVRASRAVFLLVGLIGVGAAGALAWQTTFGDLTLIVDFYEVAYPPYEAVAAVLPDYLVPGPTTWTAHWIASFALLGLASVGWYHERRTQAPVRHESPALSSR